jgi:hypothetical protein
MNKKFTAQDIINACPGTGGIKALIAKKLGCDRITVARYAKRYPTVQYALEQADEEITDLAESKAVVLINAEYWPAIKHRLDTKGKERGFTERRELTGRDGGAIELMDRTDELRAELAAKLAKIAVSEAG